jgi:hypothetical protein
MKETLPMFFSRRISPEEIKSLLNELQGDIFLRLYCDRNPDTMFFNDGMKPHGYIRNILFDDEEGYHAFIEIPDEFEYQFKFFINPVIHPCMTGTDGNYYFRFFEMMDECALITDNVYNGIKKE